MKDIIYNPIFKDTVIFLKTSKQTQGLFSEMEVHLASEGGNPLHKHTAFNETFTVIEGELGLQINGKNRLFQEGESITVRPGEAHRFFNPGTKEVKFNLVFSPGHTGAEFMLRILYGLAGDGETNKKGIPKNLLVTLLLLDMGDSALTGLSAVLTPFIRSVAKLARKKGLEAKLINKYCTIKERPISPNLAYIK